LSHYTIHKNKRFVLIRNLDLFLDKFLDKYLIQSKKERNSNAIPINKPVKKEEEAVDLEVSEKPKKTPQKST